METFNQKRRIFCVIIAMFYMPYGYGFNIQLPVSLDTQGYLSTGLVTSYHSLRYMGWIESSGGIALWQQLPLLTKWHQQYLTNGRLNQLTQQMSIGGGIGYSINNRHALKVYAYQGWPSVFLQGSVPVVDRHLDYQKLIGGIEIQAPRYRFSINVNSNTLSEGLWKESSWIQGSTSHERALSCDYDISSIASKAVVRRYYYDLYRHKFDLIDLNYLGFNTQIQWHYSKRLKPYIGAYYNEINFQIPTACYQYCSSSYNIFYNNTTVSVGYDIQFSKQVFGLHFGFHWCFDYIQFEGKGIIDNFNSWQGAITLNIPSLFTKNIHNPHGSLLAYQPPMLHMTPTSYARTITTNEWSKRLCDQKMQWVLPHRRSLLKDNLGGYTRLTPQLTFKNIVALREHILKMAKYYDDQTDALGYLKISTRFLKKYFEQMTNTVVPESFPVSHRGNAVIPSFHAHGSSHFALNSYWDFVEKALYNNSFEDLKGNADFAQLTQSATAKQLQGVQFFMNAAHLFHTLDPRSAVGIIHLAKGNLRFKVKDSINARTVYKPLPADINAMIIDYLLLEKSRVEQILDQRYHNKPQEIAMMRKSIINTLV